MGERMTTENEVLAVALIAAILHTGSVIEARLGGIEAILEKDHDYEWSGIGVEESIQRARDLLESARAANGETHG